MKETKRIKSDYGTSDIFKFYRKNYTNNVRIKEFSKVLNRFNNLIIQELYKGGYIIFPYNLGDLFITKFKHKYKFDENGNIKLRNVAYNIDFKATNELWKENPKAKEDKILVYYDNFHSDGYRVKIMWRRYHKARTNKIYNFRASRTFRRNLAAYFKSNPNQSYYD